MSLTPGLASASASSTTKTKGALSRIRLPFRRSFSHRQNKCNDGGTEHTLLIQQPQCSSLQFCDLPVEILLQISRNLDPAEACVLSVLDKRFQDIFEGLREVFLERTPERRGFLLLLERDLPNYLLCYTCVKLYKWKLPDVKIPRLCPNRVATPHVSYGHLDFQDHDRRIPRELIDLADRWYWDGSDYGISAYKLIKKMQAAEKIGRDFRMPVRSEIEVNFFEYNLVVGTNLEVRLGSGDTHNPLLDIPEYGKLIDSTWPGLIQSSLLSNSKTLVKHSRLSSLTRYLGCNIHEYWLGMSNMATPGGHHVETKTYLCLDCQTSVSISVRYILKAHRTIVNISTKQALASRTNATGLNCPIASASPAYRRLSPEATVTNLHCGRDERDLSPHPDVPQAPFNITPDSRFMYDRTRRPLTNLSVHDWFKRHHTLCERRIWNDESDEEDWVFNQLSPAPILDDDGFFPVPYFSNSMWKSWQESGGYVWIPRRKTWFSDLVYHWPRSEIRGLKYLWQKHVDRMLKDKPEMQAGSAPEFCSEASAMWLPPGTFGTELERV